MMLTFTFDVWKRLIKRNTNEKTSWNYVRDFSLVVGQCQNSPMQEKNSHHFQPNFFEISFCLGETSFKYQISTKTKGKTKHPLAKLGKELCSCFWKKLLQKHHMNLTVARCVLSHFRECAFARLNSKELFSTTPHPPIHLQPLCLPFLPLKLTYYEAHRTRC